MVEILARLVRLTHHLVYFFVLIGCFLPWRDALVVHAIFVPLMMIGWKVNNDTCFLTNLEHWLRGTSADHRAQEGEFIKSILARFIDPLPPDELIERWIYIITCCLWGVTLFRLYGG